MRWRSSLRLCRAIRAGHGYLRLVVQAANLDVLLVIGLLHDVDHGLSRLELVAKGSEATDDELIPRSGNAAALRELRDDRPTPRTGGGNQPASPGCGVAVLWLAPRAERGGKGT